MAETPVLEIKTLDAIKSIKDLKEYIKQLNKELDNADKNSKTYTKAVNSLAAAKKALSLASRGASADLKTLASSVNAVNVQFNEQGKVINAETTSLDAMRASLNQLKADYASVGSEMERSDLRSKIESLTEEINKQEQSIGVFSRNVGNYKSALDGYAGTMSSVKQIGNGLNSGIASMASIFGTLGIATKENDRVMKSWAATMAIINGAEGLTKGIANLRKWIDAKKASTMAEEKDTVAKAQNTTVTRENTVAKEVNDKATKKLTVSVNLLKVALGGIATLLAGALIANFDKVANAARSFLVNIGLINAELDSGRFTVEKYKDEQKKLNTEFEHQIAIMGAQGLPQKDIIDERINHWSDSLNGVQGDIQDINQELTETEIKTAKTVKNVQMLHPTLGTAAKLFKGFGRWLAGTNEAYKNLNETLSAATETEKEYQENLEQAQFDKTLEEIREETEKNREAAARALEEAKRKAEELAQTITKAVDKSKEAITETLSPVEQINQKYKEQFDMLYSGLTALDEQAKKGKNLAQIAEQRRTIESGITALTVLQTKELQKQAASDFLEKMNQKAELTKFSYEKWYEMSNTIYRLGKDVFGYTDAQMTIMLKRAEEYGKEIQYQAKLNNGLLQDVLRLTNGLEGMEEAMEKAGIAMTNSKIKDIENVFEFSLKDPEGFAKSFEEPLATAIKEAYGILKDNKELKESAVKEISEIYKTIFEDALKAGNLDSADEIAIGYLFKMQEAWRKNIDSALPRDFETLIRGQVQSMYTKLFDELVNNAATIPNVAKFADDFIVMMFPKDEMVKQRAEAWMKIINSVVQSYGNATANMLGKVGDMWDTYLKLRYKKQVESGRMTEEEAKAQAERAFKNVKALQISTAVISTAAAVVQALADPTVPSWYVKAANAAAALAAGTAQVMQIKMTEFGAPSVKNSSSSEPQLVDRTPQLQYVIGLNPQDYAAAQAQNPIHAYVVDKELSEGLDNYNRRRNETSF